MLIETSFYLITSYIISFVLSNNIGFVTEKCFFRKTLNFQTKENSIVKNKTRFKLLIKFVNDELLISFLYDHKLFCDQLMEKIEQFNVNYES